MDESGIGPTELASVIGSTKQDISRWANGERKLPVAIAAAAAEALGTTPNALLMLPEISPTRVPFGGRIGAGGAIDVSTEQADPGVHYEIELMMQVPGARVAYQVIGESMLPMFEPDTVIVCRAHTTEIDKHLGRRVALGTIEHGRQLKIIHGGSEPGLYDLESLNAATMRNVKVEWVSRIAAIIPADEWHLIQEEIAYQNRQEKQVRRSLYKAR